MQVHRLEDYRIHNRQGRSRGTGGYYVNRMGHKKETMVYSVYYETDAGEFSPEQWLEIMRECVAASGSEALLQRIIDHVKASCVWLKKDAEREEYALGHTCRKNLQARACVERLFDRGYLRKHSVCL